LANIIDPSRKSGLGEFAWKVDLKQQAGCAASGSEAGDDGEFGVIPEAGLLVSVSHDPSAFAHRLPSAIK